MHVGVGVWENKHQCADLAIEDGTLGMHVSLLGLAQDKLHAVETGHLQHVAQLGPATQHSAHVISNNGKHHSLVYSVK